MRKLKLFSLLLLLLIGVGQMWGTKTTYQHVFTTKPNTGNNVSLSGVNWNISATNLNGYQQAYAGVQFGSGGTNKKVGSITLTSSNAWGGQSGTYSGKSKITAIRVWCNQGGNSVTTSVTIGGNSITGSGSVSKNSSSGGNWENTSCITFTPTASNNTGVVVITATTGTNKIAGYICCIEIDCEEPGGTNNPTLSSVPSPANSGTIVIKNSSNQTVASGSEFTASEEFTLTATPASGYGFGYWSLSSGSDATITDADANPASITMGSKTTTVTANFAQLATVADASSITCTGASFAITNSANRNNYIVYTTSSTAEPTDDGNSWSTNQYGNGTITISSGLDKNTTYYYWCASNVFSSRYVYTTRKSFTTTNGFDLYLTTSDGNGNTVEATKETCITSGTSVTLTAHPTSGYVLAGWTVKDEDKTTIDPTSTGTNTFTFSMPAKDVEAAAIFQQQVVAPTFSPAAGTYGSAQNVAISTTTPNATIYYTIGTNPAAPTTGSTPYTSAISVSSNQTIKAIAVKDGMANSAVSTAAYTIKCAAPTFVTAGGTYTGAQSVAINVPTGTTVYYTTDGSTPDNTKTEYTGAINVAAGMTIKAIAIKDGMANSEVASATYTIKYTVTWKVNGVEYTEGDPITLVNSGASVTKLPTDPDPADYCGQRFMGWTNSDMGSTMGQSAPGVLFKTTGDAPAVNGTTVYHAVFADYAN